MSKLSNQNKIIVGVLSIFLIVIVGYAIFSESINIGGTASASGDFNIIFNSVGTIKEAGSSGATAEISSNKKSLTVNVPKLEYPSAYVEVPVVIKNMGSMTAKIIGIETVGLDTTDIKVTYSGVAQNDRMTPNEERNMKIKVTWDSASTTIVDSLTFSVSINYEQVSDGDITIPTPEQSDLFTWDGPGIVSGLSDKGIDYLKSNGGHLVIPEGVTEIASPNINMETGEGNFDKGFSPIAIGKLSISDPDILSKLQDPNINIIKSVSFPSTLKKIGAGAFYYCAYLTGELNLPESLEEIGISAFESVGVSSIVFGRNVQIIKRGSFSECENLTGSLYIPNSVKTIENYAFRVHPEYNKLTSISIGKDTNFVLEGIQNEASFYGRPTPTIRD